LLTRLFIDASSAAALHEAEWDVLIRIGRSSRLLGTLRARLHSAGVLSSVPERVRQHLESDYALARFQRQMTVHELRALARLLEPLGTPLIILKGAAYILQELKLSDGRFVSDVDLMVPQDRLQAAETRLTAADWAFAELDPYDERYYRAWSHELPPMRCAGHRLELDLHHTILPPTGRIQPNARALIERSIPVAGTAFRVLSPEDQVLHACAHLAQDSDFAGRLRDVVDVDALVREHSVAPGFWDTLMERAELHGLGRPLWYSLRYCSRWLETPIPSSMRSRLQRYAPPRMVRSAMDWLVPRSALPDDPDRGASLGARFARTVLLARSHWLRMPPGLLIRHLAVKAVRRHSARRSSGRSA